MLLVGFPSEELPGAAKAAVPGSLPFHGEKGVRGAVENLASASVIRCEITGPNDDFVLCDREQRGRKHDHFPGGCQSK